MTRRRFGLESLALVASLFLLPGWGCSKASDLISSLRAILQAVEHALGLLGALTGLLPDVVSTAAKYLLAVAQYVEKVATLLEDETQTAPDKARLILAWAASLVVPTIADQRARAILQAVAAAVDHFLGYFGTNQAGAERMARSQPKVPDLAFSEKDKEQLKTIPPDAMKDERAVEDWQKRALAAR